MKNIVVSAVNFVEGGALTVLNDAIDNAEFFFERGFEVYFLVNDKSVYNKKFPNFHFLEYPLSKKNWFIRLFYEYIYFWFLSLKLKPYIWLSLHDVTPNVFAKKRAVYCHNPSPFYRARYKDAVLDYKFFIFNKFYIYIYKFLINKNQTVIVQQDWIADEFSKFFLNGKIVVNPPEITLSKNISDRDIEKFKKFTFFYPSLPRVFKNFEVVLHAFSFLPENIRSRCQLIIPLSGDENRYSKYLFKLFKEVDGILFDGRQPRDKMAELYSNSDIILFPSKLETWGLPISEAILFNKPLLVADLKYARNTVGGYKICSFIDPDEIDHWRQKMIYCYENKENLESLFNHDSVFSCTEIKYLRVNSWKKLFSYLIEGV